MQKHIFQVGDLIGFQSFGEEYHYYRVTEVRKNSLTVMFLRPDECDCERPVTVPLTASVDYFPYVTVTHEELVSFCRYEIPITALIREDAPPECILCDEPFRGTPEDMVLLLHNCLGKDPQVICDQWLDPFIQLGDEMAVYGEGPEDDFTVEESFRLPPSEEREVSFLETQLVTALLTELDIYPHEGPKPSFQKALSDIIRQAQALRREQGLPPEQRTYSKEVRLNYLRQFGDDEKALDTATPQELVLYRKFVEELCKEGEPYALRLKAYACYGGNRAYDCDWVTARDLLLKLTKEDLDATVANTLGYIYYYGRCTDGKPEYDKAFYWFSLGAAGGIYESRYKIADMLMKGNGVPKGQKLAADIIADLYHENLFHIRDGHFDCKFADLALRFGNCFRNGTGTKKDADMAYQLYLEAEYAIRKRRETAENYGDGRVEQSIQRAIADVLPETEFTRVQTTVEVPTLAAMPGETCMNPDRVCVAVFKPLKRGGYSIRFHIEPEKGEKEKPKLFVTVPPAHLCGHFESITLKTKDLNAISFGHVVGPDETQTVYFNHITYVEEKGLDVLLLNDDIVAIISSRYLFTVPKEKNPVETAAGKHPKTKAGSKGKTAQSQE